MGTGATGLGRRTRRAAAAEDQDEGPTIKPVVLTSYQAALDLLDRAPSVERTRPKNLSKDAFSLDRMRALMDALGNPEKEVRFVHVAGSKGKGSVCEMLTACLAASGYTTGLYTSPHLIDVRERIRINADTITEQEFTRGLARVATAALAIRPEHGEATYFELTTALAFQHFRDMAVDIAVVEVGLGGRLDSTNVITPEVCAVAAIQLEHTQLLGDTLPLIAAEKAGIFKPGVPAITIPQQPGVIEVFREHAANAGAPLSVLKEDIDFSYRVEASPGLGPHVRVSLTTPQSAYEHLPVPLRGEHQAFNCGLVLAVLDRLRSRGFDASETKVASGLRQTRSDGRMEMICNSPRIMIDGAHNPESLQALVRAIGGHVRYDSMVMVFGCAADKDVAGMLERVALGADKIIFTRAADNPRAMQPRELHKRFVESSGKMADVADTVPDALRLAARAVGRDDLIVVTGSFHLAGEAKRFIRQLEESRAARR